MIKIDGSYGEGGGQIIRTSLALSLVTGKPFSISNVRSGRRKPGLMRQHVTAATAAAEIGGAKMQGAKIGSGNMSFEPGKIRAGRFHYDIGSAGSCTLVFQTLAPALMFANDPSELVLEGGTHNPYAPPFDFLEKAFIQLLDKMGANVCVALEVPGFYPAGGGRFRVSIVPVDKLNGLSLINRGRVVSRKAKAVVSNLPAHIARRELKTVGEKLGWSRDCLQMVEVENARGPGNVLTLEIESESVTEVFTGFGQKGVPAEKVAEKTAKEVLEYLDSDAPVGKYLADQLLIPMAMAGKSVFRTLSPTKHTATNIDIVRKFLEVHIESREYDDKTWMIEIG